MAISIRSLSALFDCLCQSLRREDEIIKRCIWLKKAIYTVDTQNNRLLHLVFTA